MKREFLVTKSLRLIIQHNHILDGSFPHPELLVNPSNIGLQGSRNYNYWMFMGRKNVDTAIHAAAGKELQHHCDNFVVNKATKAGDCVITPSFNLLSSHGIQRLAHVVTPRLTALSSVEDSAEGVQLKTELQRCMNLIIHILSSP